MPAELLSTSSAPLRPRHPRRLLRDCGGLLTALHSAALSLQSIQSIRALLKALPLRLPKAFRMKISMSPAAARPHHNLGPLSSAPRPRVHHTGHHLGPLHGLFFRLAALLPPETPPSCHLSHHFLREGCPELTGSTLPAAPSPGTTHSIRHGGSSTFMCDCSIHGCSPLYLIWPIRQGQCLITTRIEPPVPSTEPPIPSTTPAIWLVLNIYIFGGKQHWYNGKYRWCISQRSCILRDLF